MAIDNNKLQAAQDKLDTRIDLILNVINSHDDDQYVSDVWFVALSQLMILRESNQALIDADVNVSDNDSVV